MRVRYCLELSGIVLGDEECLGIILSELAFLEGITDYR